MKLTMSFWIICLQLNEQIIFFFSLSKCYGTFALSEKYIQELTQGRNQGQEISCAQDINSLF